MRIRTSAAALLALTVAGGAITLAPAANAAADPVIVNCLGKDVRTPKQIVLACADAGIAVTGISWTIWNANRAKGRGTLTWNTCLPTDCASGIVQTYRVRITLGGVADAPGEPSTFSAMRLAFPQGGPAGAETATYTLDNSRR
jgi:hypothetical protein